MHHDDAIGNIEEDEPHDAAELDADGLLAGSQAKLQRIEQLVRKYNHPGTNVGAHKLAGEVLGILEGGE